MVIGLTFGTIICCVIFISVFALFSYLLTRKFPRLVKSPGVGALIAVIPAVVIGLPLYQLYANPLYVVNNGLETKTLMLIGTSDFDLGNGKTAKVSFEWGRSHVVNQSDRTLTVETVHYGNDNFDPYAGKAPVIPPHSTGAIWKVDYCPLQTPPQSLELKGSDAHRVFWLRTDSISN